MVTASLPKKKLKRVFLPDVVDSDAVVEEPDERKVKMRQKDADDLVDRNSIFSEEFERKQQVLPFPNRGQVGNSLPSFCLRRLH